MCFAFFSEKFISPLKLRKRFGIVGLFCTINRCFEYRIRILCIFLYMGTWCKDNFRHFSSPKIEFVRLPQIEFFLRSVNNFRIEDFWS